jgi:hypothetical protein
MWDVASVEGMFQRFFLMPLNTPQPAGGAGWFLVSRLAHLESRKSRVTGQLELGFVDFTARCVYLSPGPPLNPRA